MSKDGLGDRMKAFERIEGGRIFLPGIPLYARIDGRRFSAFTRGLERPFDPRLSRAMIAVTIHLVEETQARIGYTQSDEISLVWHATSTKDESFFAGRIQKVVSILAGMATAAFAREAAAEGLIRAGMLPPHFDARAFSLANREEAANLFLWRELDATKNAVSMAARAYYGHAELSGKSSSQLQEMLFAKGINFNDYPPGFRRGTFVRRVGTQRPLDPTTLARIPEPHRPRTGSIVRRNRVVAVEMPRFGGVLNRAEVIFDGAEPVTEADLPPRR